MEHYNTFTAYDYPTRRNRKIGIVRRALTLIFLVAVWFIVASYFWHIPKV